MTRKAMDYFDHYMAVMKAMTSHGLLLGSRAADGRPNMMTIGWGALGHIWGEPIWTVLVRPSRHTYGNIEHSGGFTVNVPGADVSMACATAGSVSGRDVDKFAETGLTAKPAGSVLAPTVAECPIVYECQVVHSNDVLPTKLSHEILRGAYVDGDYHRVYYGKILSAAAAADAAERLGE